MATKSKTAPEPEVTDEEEASLTGRSQMVLHEALKAYIEEVEEVDMETLDAVTIVALVCKYRTPWRKTDGYKTLKAGMVSDRQAEREARAEARAAAKAERDAARAEAAKAKEAAAKAKAAEAAKAEKAKATETKSKATTSNRRSRKTKAAEEEETF